MTERRFSGWEIAYMVAEAVVSVAGFFVFPLWFAILFALAGVAAIGYEWYVR